MSSTMVETDETPPASNQTIISGLESQILNSQEVIVRLNRELDSALLRINTLENLCAEHQSDLHEKRVRIQELNDEVNEYEEKNEQLQQEISDRDERLKSLDDLIIQLKQHIKQAKQDSEEDEQIDGNDQYKSLFNELTETTEDFQSVRSQLLFDQQLRQLLLREVDNDVTSPQAILDQIRHNERLKFLDLLQKSTTINDISSLINSDDLLFESLTHLNSLVRLKETLSNDSQQLQHIRSLLRDATIEDLLNKRECLDYLRAKIHSKESLTDFDLVKHVLHEYFNYQQQQIELKEFLHVDEHDAELNCTRAVIERCAETTHAGVELHERVKKHEQTIEELNRHLEEYIREGTEKRMEIDKLVTEFGNNQDSSEASGLTRIRLILQSNAESLTKDDQPSIDELTRQIGDLNEQADKQRTQLKAIAGSLGSDNDDEESQFARIRSSLQSLTDLRLALAEQTSTSSDDDEAIVQRVRDYKRIIDTLHSNEDPWTKETTVELIAKLKQMENAGRQAEIEELADRFAPKEDNAVEGVSIESPVTRIASALQSSVDFRLALTKETQETSDEAILQSIRNAKIQSEQSSNQTGEFRRRVQELTGVHEDDPERILHRIHLVGQVYEHFNQQDEMIEQLKQLPPRAQIDEMLSNDRKLRDLFGNEDDEIVETVVREINRLKTERETLVNEKDAIDNGIEHIADKFGVFSSSSSLSRIEEICTTLDSFIIEFQRLLSLTDDETSTLIEIFEHTRSLIVENNQLKEIIDQIRMDTTFQNSASKLQAFVINIAQNREEMKRAIDFKENLLTRLSIDDEKQVFDRLAGFERTNAELKRWQEKMQYTGNISNMFDSLHKTLTEQREKIAEQENTSEKLRAQRERMLSKMKEMKTNNEALISQHKIANQSLEDLRRSAMDHQMELEEVRQQLRSANERTQVSLDESRSQQDLQEMMKLENESLQIEMETQRKLYETRCRTIVHEKNQLDKNRHELIEQKQILDDENKRLQKTIDAIRDSLENADDYSSLVEAVVALRRAHSLLIVELGQRDDLLRGDNEKLLFTIRQNQTALNEHIQSKIELERRLYDNEQQLMGIRQETQEKIDELTKDIERVQKEYQQYRDEQQTKKTRTDSAAAMISIEQSPLPPQPHLLAVQQAAGSNNWLAIDMDDQQTPLINQHPLVDNLTALLNLLGELKSKLGCTLTHRPRSSSFFFIYLCIIHLLIIYFLFFRHC